MDEMKLESKFVTALVSKLIKSLVKKKLGYEAEVKLNQFRTVVFDDKAQVHLDIDLELSKEELSKLIERFVK